jgi:hypothetical protein
LGHGLCSGVVAMMSREKDVEREKLHPEFRS